MSAARTLALAGQSPLLMRAEPLRQTTTISGRSAAGLSRAREVALIRQAQNGSDEALEELFRRHWPRAHRAAYLVVHDAGAAEDIAQEAFLAAIRALERFDRRRPFGPWLHRIAVNRAIDWARARRFRGEASLLDADVAADDAGPPISQPLLAALGRLAPEQRAVVVLRYVLEYTPGEISQMLELPRGTVNSRMRRALDELRPQLEREDER